MKFSLVLFALFACLSLSAKPLAKISQREVNGYKVHFIYLDIESEMISFGVRTPNGLFHDSPEKAGLSHYWEHVAHRSNEVFEDAMKEWARIEKISSGSFNAQTATNSTLYFGSFHSSAFSDVARFYGAMTTRPLFSEKHAELEKGPVIAEIKDDLSLPSTVLQDILYSELTPSNHPLRKYSMGMPEQIESFTVEDIKDLFYKYFTPGSMELLIVGGDPNQEDERLLELQQHFKPPKTSSPRIKDLKEFVPSFIPRNETSQFIKIHNDLGERKLRLSFEVPRSLFHDNFATMELIQEDLLIKSEGSLKDILSNQDLVTGIGAYRDNYDNLGMFNVTFNLTEKGTDEYKRVLQIFYEYFGTVATRGYSDQRIKYLLERNKGLYKDIYRYDSIVLQHLSDNPHHLKDQVLDLDNYFGSTSNQKIKSFIKQAFTPKNSIGAVLGDFNLENPEKSSLFKWPIERLDYNKTTKRWIQYFERSLPAEQLFFKNRVPKLKLKKTPVLTSGVVVPLERNNDLEPKIINEGLTSGQHLILKEDHSSTNIAMTFNLSLKMKKTTPKQYLSRWLLDEAFTYKEELFAESLERQGFLEHLSLNENGISLSLEAKRDQLQPLTEIILNKVKNFEIDERSFKYAIDMVEDELLEFYEQKPASIALSTAISVLVQNDYPVEDLLNALDDITLEDLNKEREKLFRVGNAYMAIVGDYSPSFSRSLYSAIGQKVSIDKNTPIEPLGLNLSRSANYYQSLENKGDEVFSIARLTPGPNINTKESAALRIFSSILNDAVFDHNRSKKGLGYVHGAHPLISEPLDANNKRQLYLALFGDTSYKDKWRMIEDGWRELYQKLVNGTLIDSNTFNDIKQAALTRQYLEPSSQIEVAEKYLMNYQVYGDPSADKNFIQQVKKLKKEDVEAIAIKYLDLNRPALTVLASEEVDDIKNYKVNLLGNCKELLTSTKAARKRLTGKN